MIVTLYRNFDKKKNSTKRPGDTGYEITGHLKEPCSIIRPKIAFQETPISNIFAGNFTYAYIAVFRRFYFVEDWQWNDGVWVVTLSVDVLATYKTDIGASQEYILRNDSTTNFNTNVSDTLYPATTDYLVTSRLLSPLFVSNLNDGVYIVGIISGTDTKAVGAITYYSMNSTQFGNLKQTLFSDTNLQVMGILNGSGQLAIGDMSEELFRTMYNPYQYIASCMWFPVTQHSVPSYDSVAKIKIGWWEYNLSGDLINLQTRTYTEHATITNHPQISRGNYLNYAPYTKRTIFGRFGSVALDPAEFKSGDSVEIDYVIDFISGHCITHIGRRYTNNNVTMVDRFTDREFLIGVPIQLAQVGVDYIGTGASVIASAGNIATQLATGNIVGAISSVGNGIANTLNSAMPQVETGGTNGSVLSAITDTAIHEIFYKIVEEDITHKGRPVCQMRQINTLSGYILCADGEIEIDAYDNERDQVIKYLTTGFFWE